MADTTPLSSLIVQSTKAAIFKKLVDIASAAGLTTETWESGDPTRELFAAVAERWETWEAIIPNVIRGGFLGLAKGDWLTLLLEQNYGVQRRAATFATCTVQITNSTSENFGTIDVDDLTFRNPSTDATFRNSTAGVLGPLATITLDIEAEVAGTGGTSAIGTITELVPSVPGLTVTNTTAAVGRDQEAEEDARQRGRAKIAGGLSQAGPRGAYEYAILTDELQSDLVSNVTRIRIIDEATDGSLPIFIAGDAGALTGPDVVKAQAAIDNWANPFVINALVFNASNVVIPIDYSLWVYDSINLTTSQVEDLVAAALLADFKDRPIGGDVVPPATSGKIYRDWIEGRILAAVAPHGFRCTVNAPVSDVDLALSFAGGSGVGEVATLGTVTPSVTIVEKRGTW